MFLGIYEYAENLGSFSHGAIVESNKTKVFKISIKDFLGIQKNLEDEFFYQNSLVLQTRAIKLLIKHKDIYKRLMTRKRSSKSLAIRPSSKTNNRKLLHKLSQTKTSNRKMDNQFKHNKRALFLQKRHSSNKALPYNTVVRKLTNKENRPNRSCRNLRESDVKKNIFNLTSGNINYHHKQHQKRKKSFIESRLQNQFIKARKNTRFDTFIKLKSLSNFVKERPRTRNLSIKKLSFINNH